MKALVDIKNFANVVFIRNPFKSVSYRQSND